MKHLKLALALSTALALSAFTGCSDDGGDDDNTNQEFATLTEYTDAHVLDWNTNWIQPASYVQANLASLYIMDVRSEADYLQGHIDGAVNVAAADIVDEAAAAGGDPICVVCYTGQTASWCTMALRMAGYEDAIAMKFGMAAWNDDFAGKWDEGAASDYVDDFVTAAAPALPEHAAPVLNTGATTAEEILAERIEAVLDAGFSSRLVTAATVFGALDDYEIYNYWSAADYTSFGHIPGAYQLTPGTLLTDENLMALDPTADNVVYCWTGQTSAFTAFYLNALGYDTYSLKYGANGMIHSELDASHAWQMGGYHANYAYQGGASEFDLMAEYTDVYFAAWSLNWVKTADYVYDNRPDLFIVDLRSAADFANGHIEGAHNVALADVADYVAANNTNSDEVAVVCYTGQNAAFATMALRMLGHDAFTMKWGMAAWNDDADYTGQWDAGVSDDFAADMVTDASPTLPVNDWPSLDTGLTSGEAIMEARVAAMLAEGLTPNLILSSTLMANTGDYHIFNYWGAADYTTLGHIDGAYQLTPGNLTTATNLSALHPTAANVLYCWTGQTSAFAGFYLNALGYDVRSLKFGANALMHEDLTQNRWTHQGFNYPVVQ